MTKLKIRKIGNSLGVVLPKEVLEQLKAKEGDMLSFARSAHGYTISTTDEDIDKLRDMAKDIMKRRRNALKVLAK